MKNKNIELGDEVKCVVSGYTGIAVQRIENLNGCIQYTLRQPVDKDGKMLESYCIDFQTLEVVKKNPHKIGLQTDQPEHPKARTGGDISRPAKRA